jgi:hypothetical protein
VVVSLPQASPTGVRLLEGQRYQSAGENPGSFVIAQLGLDRLQNGAMIVDMKKLLFLLIVAGLGAVIAKRLLDA